MDIVEKHNISTDNMKEIYTIKLEHFENDLSLTIFDTKQSIDDDTKNTKNTKNNRNKKIENIDKFIVLNIPNMTFIKSNVTSLELNDIHISDIAFILLRDSLITNITITSIIINECNLSDIGAIALSEVINSGNKTISSIKLHLNEINKIGINSILKSLKNNKYILNFSLYNVGCIHQGDIESLELTAEILEINNTLVVFVIDNIISFYHEEDKYDNILKYEKVLDKFANALKKNISLHFLGLQYNNITSNDINIICSALEHNTTLKGIDISGNCINDRGLIYLSNYLKNNKSLEYINLYNDNECYTFVGIKMLIEALQFNSTLLGCHFLEIESWGSLYLQNELIAWCNENLYINEDGTLYIEPETRTMTSIVNMIPSVKSIIYPILKNNDKSTMSIKYYQDWVYKWCFTINHKTTLLLQFENSIDNNKNLYNSVYWNPWKHLSFKNIDKPEDYITFECHQLVMATLVCNSYLQTKLSIYLWQYIFSFYQKKQFLSR